MKRLFIGMVALAAIACKKEAIQSQCGMVYEVKDFATLDKKVSLAIDTLWTSETVVCGQQFQNYILEEQSGPDKPFTSYCPNGITLSYYRLRIITKK